MFRSTFKFLLALWGLELGCRGAPQGEPDLREFIHGGIPDPREDSALCGVAFLGNLDTDLCIPKKKLLREPFRDSRIIKHNCVSALHEFFNKKNLMKGQSVLFVPADHEGRRPE